MFEKLTIQHSQSINDALKQMDLVRRKLLMVYNSDKFIGLVSIGDIQRAIISNRNLNTPISEILRAEIILANKNEDKDLIRKKMVNIRSEFMPVVDEKNNVVDVIFWEDIITSENVPPHEKINLPVVIMAGGKGTRLKPITNILPKPLIPVGEKPIVEHIIDRFLNVGCNKFFLSVNYKSEFIEYYFDSIDHHNYTIEFFKEQKPLGTAGSLHLLEGKINTTFFVSNCDILIDQDYSEIYKYHKTNANDLTLVAALKYFKIPYGTVETGTDGLLLSMKEKPEIVYKINAGLYLLEPNLINEIPKNEFFHITELISLLQKKGRKIGVFPVSENSWKDIGDWDEYLRNKE